MTEQEFKVLKYIIDNQTTVRKVLDVNDQPINEKIVDNRGLLEIQRLVKELLVITK